MSNKKECCGSCTKCFMKRCEILKESNPEYKELTERKIAERINGDYLTSWAKMNEIENNSICPQYQSIHITYPLVVEEIKNGTIDYSKCLGHDVGCLVAIQPCGEEYKKKTYLGFLIGDLPWALGNTFNRKTGVLESFAQTNPAIFVPELKKIIFGYESWWKEIESEEDFKEITNEDISNTWYVKLLKEMSKKEEK